MLTCANVVRNERLSISEVKSLVRIFMWIMDVLQIEQADTLGEVRVAVHEAGLSHLDGMGCVRNLSERDDLVKATTEFYLEGRLEKPLQQ